MKRIILCLTVIIMVFSFTSCGNASKYIALEIGGHSAEVMLEDKEISEYNSGTEKIISYRGNDYTVSYDHSVKSFLYNNDVECYKMSKDGVFVNFDINKKTGMIEKYSWFDNGYIDSPDLIEKAQDDCEKIAKNYLSEYVDDISAYVIDSIQYYDIPEYGALYSFDFIRKAGEIKTSDSASIGVTKYGDVVSHTFSSLGEMKTAELPSDDNMKSIADSVSKKLSDIYKDVENKYDVSFNTKDIFFMRLADGRYALEYIIEALLSPVGEETGSLRERVELLIYV